MGKIIKSTGSNYVPDKVNQYMSFIFICSIKTQAIHDRRPFRRLIR